MRPIVKRSIFFLALLGAAFAAGAAPGAEAASRPDGFVLPESFRFEAQLPSRGGYSIYLRGYGHDEVELDVSREDLEEPYVTAEYKTLGQVSPHGVTADFGEFGKVDLHFVGTLTERPYRVLNCKGRPGLSRSGEMAGEVQLDLVGGAAELVTEHIAEGQTIHQPRRHCTRNGPSGFDPGGPEIPSSANRAERPRIVKTGESSTPTFLARAHRGGRTIDLYALGLDSEVIDMAATTTRRFGQVLVKTSVHAAESEEPGPGKAVELTIHGRGIRPPGATLTASTPFSGHAIYRRGPGSWLGNLAVTIPGEGRQSLAGPEFKANLCGFNSVKKERACEATVAPPHIV